MTTKLLNTQETYKLLFDNFMNDAAFYYPYVSNDLSELHFTASPSFFHFNENLHLSSFTFFQFCWAQIVRKQNPGLYECLTELITEKDGPTDQIKKDKILRYFRSDELPMIFSNPELLDYFYSRITTFIRLMDEIPLLLENFLKKYAEEAIDYLNKIKGRKYPNIYSFLYSVERRFPATVEISEYSKMDKEDVRDLIIRDYLLFIGKE